MATETYIPLATVTLAASSSAVYFTEISQDYSDLVLVVEQKGGAGNSWINVRFNGDSSTSYFGVSMAGSGSSTQSATLTQSYLAVGGGVEYSDGTNPQLAILQINGFSATDNHKTMLSRSNVAAGGGVGTAAYAGRWANTAAITSIAFVNRTFAAGSTFKLFGIHGEVV
jgi:hypothetical protein